MALVVTARSPVAVAARSPLVVRSTRPRRFAMAVAVAYAVALSVDAAARAMPTTEVLQAINLAATALGCALTLALSLAAWLTHRTDSGLLLGATLAPVLAAIRVVAAALLTTLELSTLAEVLNVSLGVLVLGALVWSAAAWRRTAASARDSGPSQSQGGGASDAKRAMRRDVATPELDLFRRVAEVTALVLFAVSVSGATVGAVGASWACRGTFPDCNGFGVLAFGRDPLADIQLYHRLLSYVALGLVLWLTIEAFRTQRAVAALPRTTVLLLSTTILSALVGAIVVSTEAPPLTEIAHTAATLATWSLAVLLVAQTRAIAPLGAVAPDSPRAKGVGGPLLNPPQRADELGARSSATPSGVDLPSPGTLATARYVQTLKAYVQLTKPRVMSLLLATTAAAMVIAARGLPDVKIFLATLLGGALMSGGAGAINHYVDRDIDPLMGRTAWRPIPSGVIAPRSALWFGIALAVLASAVFLVAVNPLAEAFALLGLLGYVFIYTLWLKRSTPSNIVIGGAAGAIPPLVGWAAVTNEISSLTAWYLFAIIFFWTPPHFWALSLLIRTHYERAGVPMLPVVRGEDETRKQIVLYSLLLVMLTLVLSPFGMMGPIYFAAAALLGGLFIRNAVRLWREATPAAARRLYLYSILYLFALFTAMAVDRVILK